MIGTVVFLIGLMIVAVFFLPERERDSQEAIRQKQMERVRFVMQKRDINQVSVDVLHIHAIEELELPELSSFSAVVSLDEERRNRDSLEMDRVRMWQEWKSNNARLFSTA